MLQTAPTSYYCSDHHQSVYTRCLHCTQSKATSCTTTWPTYGSISAAILLQSVAQPRTLLWACNLWEPQKLKQAACWWPCQSFCDYYCTQQQVVSAVSLDFLLDVEPVNCPGGAITKCKVTKRSGKISPGSCLRSEIVSTSCKIFPWYRTRRCWTLSGFCKVEWVQTAPTQKLHNRAGHIHKLVGADHTLSAKFPSPGHSSHI